MIASLGGAIVNNDGSRQYPASGGLVGGLSFLGAGSSNFTGAGKAYYRFTPYQTESVVDMPIDSLETVDTRDGGNGSGGTPTPITPVSSNTGRGGNLGTSGGGLNLPTVGGGYRGLSGIQQGGNIITSALNSIFGAYQSGAISLQQALLEAQKYSGYLYDPNVFYQAQKGKDASLLMTLKAQAANFLNAIRNWVAPQKPTEPTKQPPVGGGDPTDIPINLPQSLLQLLASLGSAPRTNVEAPPNLFSFDPSGAGNNAPSNTMRNLGLLAVIGVIVYFVWKKYA